MRGVCGITLALVLVIPARVEAGALAVDTTLGSPLQNGIRPEIIICPDGPRVFSVDAGGAWGYRTGSSGRGPFSEEWVASGSFITSPSAGDGGSFVYVNDSTNQLFIVDACGAGPFVPDLVTTIPSGYHVSQTATGVLPDGSRIALYRQTGDGSGVGPTFAQVETLPGSGVFNSPVDVASGYMSSSGREYSLAVNAAGTIIGIYCVTDFEFIQVVSTDWGASWNTTVVSNLGDGNAAIAVDPVSDGFLVALTPETARVDLYHTFVNGTLTMPPVTVTEGLFGDFGDIAVGGTVDDVSLLYRNDSRLFLLSGNFTSAELVHDPGQLVTDADIRFGSEVGFDQDIFYTWTDGTDLGWVVSTPPGLCSSGDFLLVDSFNQTGFAGNVSIFGPTGSQFVNVNACFNVSRDHFISFNAVYPSATGTMTWGEFSPTDVLQMELQDAFPGDTLSGGVGYVLGGLNMTQSGATSFQLGLASINGTISNVSMLISDTLGNFAHNTMTALSSTTYLTDSSWIAPTLLSDVDILAFTVDLTANSDASAGIDFVRVPEPVGGTIVVWVALGAILWLRKRTAAHN